MQFKNAIAALALAGTALAQRPMNTSICDYYTGALFKDNNATNQLALLTRLVNTVVIGNYSNTTVPNAMKVPGILANGTINGTTVHLLPYFNGALASSNRGGKAVAINFLDDGGATPLKMDKPANGTSSNQYRLLTHLYQFFGTLLGCSKQGMDGYSNYMGNPSMFDLHRYMYLNSAQNTYFIMQVGAAAAYLGVAADDITGVAQTLAKTFNYRCSPNIILAPALGSQMQSICTAPECMIDPNGTCSAYPTVMMPAVANTTLAEGLGNSSMTPTATAPNGGAPTGTSGGAAGGSSATSSAGAAQIMGSGLAAGLGLFAFLL